MKPIIKLLAMASVLMLTGACSGSKDKPPKTQEKYQITSPLIIDTTYHTDYVSDIHSVRNVEIRARVKGYIEAIHVDEGKYVKKGQLLFSISKNEYKEELLRAKALLKNAIAEAKAAELTLQNTKLLVDKNVVSRAELEMAQSKLEALNAKIDEAKSQESSAQLKLSLTDIKAPFDGVIDRIPNKVGSLIDEGTLLTTLSDNSEVFAYFNVSEKEYLDFAQKLHHTTNRMEVTLILANNKEHTYKGHIETMEGEFDKVTGSIAFRARFPNPERLLKHGASGKIRMMNKLDNALVIPQKSTFEIQDRTYVYVIDQKNKVKMRSFTSKLRIPHLYILESGLSPSDKIIYEGIQELREGTQVETEFVSLKEIITQLEEQ
ncbi:MAG: efflux RND transporter periplasmic adaptor subunit [Spirosomataceae bacterium]